MEGSAVDSNAIFFLAGLIAPLVLLIVMPRLWRHILAGYVLFLYLLLAFAGFPLLLALLLFGLIPALIAYGKEHNFLIWWGYGAVLPIVALPHALLLRRQSDALPAPETYA